MRRCCARADNQREHCGVHWRCNNWIRDRRLLAGGAPLGPLPAKTPRMSFIETDAYRYPRRTPVHAPTIPPMYPHARVVRPFGPTWHSRRLQVQLVIIFNGHEPHSWPRDSFGNRLGIDIVALVRRGKVLATGLFKTLRIAAVMNFSRKELFTSMRGYGKSWICMFVIEDDGVVFCFDILYGVHSVRHRKKEDRISCRPCAVRWDHTPARRIE